MSAQAWGGWITLVAIGLSLVTLVVVHMAPTGLNPFRNPVSQYHLTRYRGWIATSTILAGVAAIGAIVALTAMLGPAALVTSILLAVFALARILIPFLRMDEPGTPLTTVGRIHYVLAYLAFGAATAAAFVAAGPLHDAGYTDEAMWSTVYGIVMAVGSAGTIGLQLARRTAVGFPERLIYVGFIAWFVLIGATALGVDPG